MRRYSSNELVTINKKHKKKLQKSSTKTCEKKKEQKLTKKSKAKTFKSKI